MGGRVTDLAVFEKNPALMYVATASGGLWKTVNGGTTWAPVFDHETTASIGAVAVAEGDANLVWAGTGEANPRNSVSWGDGVYKSTDGGKTWKNMGLPESHHIGRVVIHPTQPDVVYVAALGHLWGPNPDRGLYRTCDGGKTWRKVLFVNANTGVIDVVMDPANPRTLYAAAYQVRRDGFGGGNPAVQTGPGGGLFRTTDGGQTWQKMTKGLPRRPLGRCGLAISRKNPRLLYAVGQTDKTDDSDLGQMAKTGSDASRGGVFRSTDRGQSWTKLNDLCPRPFYFGKIRLDPADVRRVYVLGAWLHLSTDGGRTFAKTDGAATAHNDHHALWIDPRNSRRMVLGGDGGLHFTHDQGATWSHCRNLPIGQYYAIGVDMSLPYRIYGGLQDHGCWGGPSATRTQGISASDWYKMRKGDGQCCQVDPTNPNSVYAAIHYGQLRRLDLRTGASKKITPRPGPKAPKYRFNWTAPLLLSPHNSRVLYFGGNFVFRSPNRGNKWSVISPDLTRGRPGPSKDSGHTLTALAESPLRRGLLYAGTDDGRLHLTTDGGGRWTELTPRLPHVLPEFWVSRIECSHFAAGTAYLALDRHRLDDRSVYLFKTTNYGYSWKSLAGNLPSGGPVRVIREDPRNRNLLYVGTEFGLFISLDGGRRWLPVRGLPTVPVPDLVVHPRDQELVIATHGRSLYVLDVVPLQELTPRVLAGAAHLCSVRKNTDYPPVKSPKGRVAGDFIGTNPPVGASCYYYLRDAPAGPVRLSIQDKRREKVCVLTGATVAGLHRISWDLRRADTRLPVPPGEYVGVLIVGGQEYRQKIKVQ
jgi:photosystem II stability/assembly factor-like uncharacterized protein